MTERYKCPVAVILLLVRRNESTSRKEVLLTKRQGGYAAGMWDLSASGHLEPNELLADAMIREAGEEIGVTIRKEDLEFSSVVHDTSPDKAYINFNFICEQFEGQPTICEPDKCSEIKWMPIDDLPPNLMTERRCAVGNYISGTHFFENVITGDK